MLNNSRWLQVLIIELVIIATLYLIQIFGSILLQFSGIWLLFFLAWLMAFALRPLIRGLVHLGVPHPLAVLIVYIALVLVFVGSGIVIFPQLTAQLTTLQSNWNDYVKQANQLVIDVQRWVEQSTGQHLDLNGMYQEATAQLQGQAGTILSNALQWLSTAAGLAFNFILVILISLYVALDGDRLANSMVNALPRGLRDQAILLGDSIGRSFGGFLRGQVIFALIYGVLNAVIMMIFGLPYVLIASIISGACMLIPLVGNFLAYMPPVLIALITPSAGGNWWLVLAVMLVMQSIMMQVVGPRIMSSAVGIHPLLTVMAMLVGAQMMGIWGALFGIPVVGVIALVSSSVFNRLKTFFSAPESSSMIGMVMAPTTASGALDPTAAAPGSPPAPSTTSLAAVAGAAAPPAGHTEPPALVRGLSWLTSATRRGGKRN